MLPNFSKIRKFKNYQITKLWQDSVIDYGSVTQINLFLINFKLNLTYFNMRRREISSEFRYSTWARAANSHTSLSPHLVKSASFTKEKTRSSDNKPLSYKGIISFFSFYHDIDKEHVFGASKSLVFIPGPGTWKIFIKRWLRMD